MKLNSIEQTLHGIGRLGSFRNPLPDSIFLYGQLLLFHLDGMVKTDLLDRSPVAGHSGINHYNSKEGPFLSSVSFQSDLDAHYFLLTSMRCHTPSFDSISAWNFLLFVAFFIMRRILSNFFKNLFTS